QRERDLLRRRSAELIEAQEVARVGHWVFDPGEGGFRCSDELYRILGLDPATGLTYQRFLDAAEPDHSERLANARHRLRTGGEALNAVYPVRRPSGEVRWVQEKVTRQASRHGDASRLTGSVADVTELVEGARELQGRNTLLERAFAAVDDGILVRRPGEILDCNAAACRILGYERNELVGSDPAKLELEDERRSGADHEGRAPGAPEGTVRARGRRKDGKAFACDLTVVPLAEDQGVEGGEIVVLRDLGPSGDSDPKERYHRGLYGAREEERRRMATDLQDGIGQALQRSRVDLEHALAHLGEDHAARESLDRMAAILDDTVGDVRHLANELRPAALDRHGLVPALEWLCGELHRRGGISCVLHADGRELPLSPESGVLVYRIVEEALSNVSRRAPGSSATVSVTRRGGDVRVEVRNDGRGLDPEALAEPDGTGLFGMRERAALLGARLRVGRSEDGGTSVRLELEIP
ncbi:MAG TPA: PAS domain S-box protein, partial [Longimicrobiales bacterium]|nr:PAS domain S-box protein [Longimicrobiales bacterium]